MYYKIMINLISYIIINFIINIYTRYTRVIYLIINSTFIHDMFKITNLSLGPHSLAKLHREHMTFFTYVCMNVHHIHDIHSQYIHTLYIVHCTCMLMSH